MAEFTLAVPDELVKRLQPFGPWLPIVLELSLLGFRTRAIAVVSELVDFLSTNPSSKAVLDYYASQESQTRLRRLLVINSEGLLLQEEQLELDELKRLEHFLVMQKASLASI
jgi:hypothetical protein